MVQPTMVSNKTLYVSFAFLKKQSSLYLAIHLFTSNVYFFHWQRNAIFHIQNDTKLKQNNNYMKILLYPHCFKNHCIFCDHTCCPFFNFIFIGPFALRRCLSCFFFVTFKSLRLSSSSSSEESFSLSFSFCFYFSLSMRLFKPEPFIKSFYEPLCNLN